jgi:hypothetical protein
MSPALRSIHAAALAALLIPTGAFRAAGAPGTVQFGRDVLPILSNKCFTCHGPDAKTRKADLRLDTRDGVLSVVTPSDSGKSELIRRIGATDADRMPPGSRRRLSAAEQELLRRWVEQGAAWGKHWAFEKPVQPSPPAVRNAAWVRSPIDRFVLARLEKEGLSPAPESDRATLIRRVTLDLTGLPPTLAEIDAFCTDRSADAYERVVDRLLASPRYGERQAMDWLDGARYADTNGYQNDFARTMWPWRDWVIDAFNRNQPFDQFTIEQIAGDLLPRATSAQRIATGFNRNNRTVTEGGSIDEEWRVENAVDRVETTATVFLGLTLGCGRCHDHKFDPITQKEFYRFFAFFNQVNEKGVYTEQRGNVAPLVQVPSSEDRRRQRQFDLAVAATEQDVRAEQAGLARRQQRWEKEQQSAPSAALPRGLALEVPLCGDLRSRGADGKAHEVIYRGKGKPAWTDGPLGHALRLPGQDEAFLDAGRAARLERTDHFSYGAWIKRVGNGAVLSKMDDAAGYRGFDLIVVNDHLEVHLAHHWPDNFLKVATRDPLPNNVWTHVFMTYDGSGKAAGVKLFVNGQPVALDVQSDKLGGTIATEQPLRLGKRSTSFPFQGELADVRLFRRTLTPDEVQALAALPLRRIAQTSPERRSPLQQELLTRQFRARYAPRLQEAQANLDRLRKEMAEYEQRVPTVMVMEDVKTPRPTYVLKRGRYDVPDRSQRVEPDVPGFADPLPSGAPRNRLGLAYWLVWPDNPLTARVIVNRYWQHYFGTGLVKTAENFGVQGEPPSHPQLLDWLATEFVRTGWDVKGLQRLIVTSATYRQSSRADAAALHRDPENRLLARGPRFRLPAEVVRDNALAVSGLLVERLGGPSVKPYQPAGLWEELAGGAGEGPYVQDRGPGLYRRSLYVYRKRTVPHPALTTFDAPTREVCQVKRARTDTPLQALELLNDVTYVEAARHLAEQALSEGGPMPEDRLSYMFRRATGRAPSTAELGILARGLARQGQRFRADREAARHFIRHGDSPLPPEIDPVELAGYTAVASIILNLDETITKE